MELPATFGAPAPADGRPPAPAVFIGEGRVPDKHTEVPSDSTAQYPDWHCASEAQTRAHRPPSKQTAAPKCDWQNASSAQSAVHRFLRTPAAEQYRSASHATVSHSSPNFAGSSSLHAPRATSVSPAHTATEPRYLT